MPDPIKPVGNIKIISQGAEQPFENIITQGSPIKNNTIQPVGKIKVIGSGREQPFKDIVDNGAEDFKIPSTTDNFINRFGLAKDQIELSMYEGFKAKANDSEGMIGSLWNKFLDNRINSNNKDIAQQIKDIGWTEEDNRPFTMSDIINRPSHFFSNQLPELLGQSIGTMAEPIISGAIAGGITGSILGPEGTIAGVGAGTAQGISAGLVGMLSGRFMESMSEAGSAYKQAIEYMKKNNPELTDQEMHDKAIPVMDDVYGKNMALGLADVPELLLAFTPMTRIIKGLGGGKMSRLIGKELIDRPYSSSFIRRNAGKIAGATKIAGVSAIEAAEEGAQFYIGEDAQNQVKDEKDKTDVSLSGMWNNPEFQTSIQSGFLLGGLLGGVGTVTQHVLNSGDKLKNLSLEDREAEQTNLRNDYIVKTAKAGKQTELLSEIHNQGEKADGIFSDMNEKDDYVRIKHSKDLARKFAKDAEEKFQVYDSINANTTIKDEDHKMEAFQNELNIKSLDKTNEVLKKSAATNRSLIKENDLNIHKLTQYNGLIGEGKTRKSHSEEFKAVDDKFKEKMAELKPEVKKTEKVKSEPEIKKNKKPVVANEPSSSGDIAQVVTPGQKAETMDEYTAKQTAKIKEKKAKAVAKEVKVESVPEQDIQPGFKMTTTGPEGNLEYRVHKVLKDSYSVVEHAIDETGKRLPGKMQIIPKQEFHDFVKENNATTKIIEKPIVDPNAAVKKQMDESIKKVKLPEGATIKYAKLENKGAQNKNGEITISRTNLIKQFDEKKFEETPEHKVTSKANGNNTEGVRLFPKGLIKSPAEYAQFVALHEVEHSITKKNEAESKADYENRINRIALNKIKKDTSFYEDNKEAIPLPKFSAKDTPIEEDDNHLKSFREKIQKRHDDLDKELKSGLNDIVGAIPKILLKNAYSVLLHGIDTHGRVKRAIKEAVESIKNSDWYKGLTKKEKRQVEANAASQIINDQDVKENAKSDLQDPADINIQEELDNLGDDSFESLKEMGLQYEDNDDRAKKVISGIRNMYKDIPGIREQEALNLLYDLAHLPELNEVNPRENLKNLEATEQGSILSEGLHDLTDQELIQLFNSMKSIYRVPFIHHLQFKGTAGFKLMVSNNDKEGFIKTIDSVEEKLKDSKRVSALYAKYQTRLTEIFAKHKDKKGNQGYASITGNKEAKAEIYDLEVKFLNLLTGEDWTPFLNKQIDKNSEYKNYRDFYINTNQLPGKNFSFTKSFAKQLLIKDLPAEMITSLRGKSDKHKSNIAQLADIKNKIGQQKLGNYFDNVVNNRKSGFVLSSHAILFANNVHKAKKDGYLANNDFVDKYSGKENGAQLFVYDGIKNEANNGVEEVGNLAENDLKMAVVINFIDPAGLVAKDEYLHTIEQLSDKKQTVFVQAQRYELIDAKKRLAELRKKDYEFHQEFPSNEEITSEIKVIKDFVEQNIKNKSIVTSESAQSLAENFVYNYILNKHFTDLYFQGKPENYYKKGKFDYVSQVKRAGSFHSSGEVLNTAVEKGIGKTARHIVVNDNLQNVEIKDNNGKVLHLFEDSDIADGQTFHTQDWDDKVKVSSGGKYSGILKPIYSSVTKAGYRVLIKSNSILLTDAYVADKPVLKNLLQVMKDNQADYLTVKSGVKHDSPESVTQIDWTTGKVTGEVHVNIRNNKNWRIQQDFTQNEALDTKRLTKQMLRHFDDFKSGPKIRQLLNQSAERELTKLMAEMSKKSDKEFKDFLLKNIEDSDTNYHARELLKSDVSLDHFHLRSFIPIVFSSIITKKALDIKGNGAIYIETTSMGTNLLGPRIEDGKVLPAQILVPENSGLQIGDKVFATRVPSSNHHSTSYSEVVGHTPKEMGNVIVMDAISMKIAGADFDGDARHLWAPFKGKSGKAISYKSDKENTSKALVNEAFNLAVAEYENPDNFYRIVNPIDTDTLADALKKSPLKEEIGNKHFLSTYIQMYRNNKDGKKVVSIVATSSKIQSLLRVHGATLKRKISMPSIKTGKNIDLSEIKKDDNTKELIANNINQAVDAAKLQNLFAMGMTESGASIYCMLEELGMPEQDVIDFFALDTVRKYLDAMSEAKSVNSPIDTFGVIDNMVKKLIPSSDKTDEENEFPKYPKDILLSRADLQEKTLKAKLNILQKVKYLVAVSNDYFAFGSLINATEKAPKTYAEYYKMRSDFSKVISDATHFEIEKKVDIDGKQEDSPYIAAAKSAIDTIESFFDEKTIFGNKQTQAIISSFEKDNSYDKESVKPLNKNQIIALTNAISSVAFADGIRNEKTREQVDKDVKDKFAKVDQENVFIKQLEIDRDKLGIKGELRRIQNSVEETKKLKDAFAALPEDFKNDLMLYNFYQYGLSNSKKNGGFSVLFDNATHKKIGDIIETTKTKWQQIPNADREILKSIIKNNPDLVPEPTLASYKVAGKSHYIYRIPDVGDYAYPTFVRQKEGYKFKILGRKKGEREDRFYSDSETSGNFIVPGFIENKVYELPAEKKLQTAGTDELLASSDPELYDFIESQFDKLYPGVNKRFISDAITLDNKPILGAYANNTVFIDKEKAVQSTYFHEHAHGYWNALPDNDSVKEKLIKIFGDEEKAIQAIGEAGVDIAKVKLNGTTLQRFKELLNAFWRKVKSAFGILNEDDSTKRMAERIWSNEDRVTFKSFGDDIIKYQLSDSVQNGQNETIAEIKKHVQKELSNITAKDIENYVTNKGKADAEIQEELKNSLSLKEGETIEGLKDNPKEFFSRLAGTESNVVLNKNEYTLTDKDFRTSYSNLSSNDKKAVDQKYERYLADVAKIDTIWKQFKTVDSFYNLNNITEIRKIFNKLNSMDENARHVMYDLMMNKLAYSRLSLQASRENMEGFSDYKLATLSLHELAQGEIKDFDHAISKWTNSGKDIFDDKKILQLHYKNIAIAQADADRGFTEVGRNLDKLEAAIKKEGGDLKNLFTTEERSGKTYKVFKKEGLTELEKQYVEYQTSVRRDWGATGKLDVLPQIQSSFFELYKKYGLWKAGQKAFFGSNSRDYIRIKDKFGNIVTLKEAKNTVKIDQEKGLLDKLKAIKLLHGYEKQAETLSKQKRHADGDLIFDNKSHGITMDFDFIANEDATDSVNAVIKTYMQQLIFKQKMDPHLPMAAFVEKLYSGDSTKFVREWLTNFNNNVLYGRNPESVMGSYAKYLQGAINFTAWRFLALNPLGAIFNLTAGATQTIRDRGLKVFSLGAKRMIASPLKYRALLRNANVVSTTVDSDLNPSEKHFRKFQNFMFGLITEAEYINQGYTYIGLLSEEEWNSYDEKGELIEGKDGISAAKDILLKEEIARTNGSYSSVMRRPLSYTTEGRAIIQFKGWLPDVFLTHLQREFVDSNGVVRKGIANTIFSTELWGKLLKNKSTKGLSEIDKKNLAKATRELMMSSMLLMWMCSVDDDDDVNKSLIAGIRRALGDITYVFDLDNMVFLLDSPLPVFGTINDLNKAFQDLLSGNTYVRANAHNEAGDLRFDDSFRKILPGNKIPDQIENFIEAIQ